MQLTPQQVTQMQARGLDLPTIEALAKQKGYTLPRERDLLEKTASIVNRIFPGGKLGESLGTIAAGGIQLAKGNTQGYRNIMDTQVPVPQIGADVVQSAVTPLAAGTGPAKTILGKAAQFGGIGAVSGGASSLAQGENLGTAAGQAVRQGAIGALIGATFGVAGKAVKGLGKGVEKTGQKIQMSVVKPTQADIKDGFKIENLKKYGVGGSLKQTLERTDARLDSLSKELNQKLAKSNASINLNEVYDRTTKRLLGNKYASFGSNSQLGGGLEKLQDEILGVSGNNGLVSIPQAQIVKRASGHFGAWTYGVPTPEANANQQIYNAFYNELKKEIEQKSPQGIAQINKQISELIPIMNAVIRRIPVAERNNALSLTDIITLTGATIDPRAFGLSVLNLASKSGKIGSGLSGMGQGIQKAAGGVQGVEQVAKGLFPSSR